MNQLSSSSFKLAIFSAEELSQFVTKRAGETKIGEEVKVLEVANDVAIKYVIIGVEEDLGPQLNEGRAGSKHAFKSFLKRFLNMQANDFLKGNEILCLGSVQSLKEVKEINPTTIIAELDQLLLTILTPYMQRGIVPIIIGGGHNNAYPAIKSSFLVKNTPINVVNLDAHADLRVCDIRHSGNPFSWAIKDGFIKRYHVLGLHQSYNNHYIINQLKANHCYHTWFDDYVDKPKKYREDVQALAKSLKGQVLGLELDLDAIAFMPSSALSPSGFTTEEARFYIREFAKNKALCYLHLPEGAPQNEGENLIVGKTLAYLVSDFIKSHQD